MVSIFVVEVTIGAASGLKYLNCRNGNINPYVVVWVDTDDKVSTNVAPHRMTDPIWNEKLLITFVGCQINEAILFLDVVCALDGPHPLIGSALLPLDQVVQQVGIGCESAHTLQLDHSSFGPQGMLHVKVSIHGLLQHEPSGSRSLYGSPYIYNHHHAVTGYELAYSAAPPAASYFRRNGAHAATGYGLPYGAPAPYVQQPWAGAHSAAPPAASYFTWYGSHAATGYEPPYGAPAPYVQQQWAGAPGAAPPAASYFTWYGSHAATGYELPYGVPAPYVQQQWAGAPGAAPPAASYLRYGPRAAWLILNLMLDPSVASVLLNWLLAT